MRIYVAHSTSFDYKEELYLPIRQSDLNSQHRFILPHEHSNDPYDSKMLISTAQVDLIVAEVSYPSTGLGIELGWADSCGIPIVCVHRADSKHSGSLKVVTDKIVSYTSHDDLIRGLEDILNIT